ncbi:MAG: hypothetical protein AB8E15_08325 [Bdellovibrionales bacterium]
MNKLMKFKSVVILIGLNTMVSETLAQDVYNFHFTKDAKVNTEIEKQETQEDPMKEYVFPEEETEDYENVKEQRYDFTEKNHYARGKFPPGYWADFGEQVQTDGVTYHRVTHKEPVRKVYVPILSDIDLPGTIHFGTPNYKVNYKPRSRRLRRNHHRNYNRIKYNKPVRRWNQYEYF